MKRSIKVAVRSGSSVVALIGAVFLFAGSAHAQFGAAPGSQGAQANQLPLSGKGAQNGSVVAVQNPVPGTTTSVNTLNPAVQVQGPFGGSTSSTTTTPFSGKLGFRDAINRGDSHTTLDRLVWRRQCVKHKERAAWREAPCSQT